MGVENMQGINGLKCTAGSDNGCPEGGCCALFYIDGLSNLGPAAAQIQGTLK